MKFITSLLSQTIMSLVFLGLFSGKSFSQKSWPMMKTLEEVALFLVLAEEFELAADTYSYLAGQKSKDPATLNNAGVNYLLEALNLFQSSELAYYLPIELSVKNIVRGTRSSSYSDKEAAKIKNHLATANKWLERVTRLAPDWSTGYLNYATSEILIQVFSNSKNYRKASEALETAKNLAGENARTLANTYMLMGILNALMGNEEEKVKMMYKANQLLKKNLKLFNEDEKRIIKENQRIASGEYLTISYGHKSPERVLPALNEEIDNIHLRSDFEKFFRPGDPLLYEIKYKGGTYVFMKELPGSYLIGIQKGEKRYLFQRTGENYRGKSARGVRIGDKERAIIGSKATSELRRTKYWYPWKTYSLDHGGKLMVYEHAKIFFELDSSNIVLGWTNWYGKASN